MLPPSVTDPGRGPACPKTARSWLMVKSQAIPISCPPATRMPLTLQMTGLSQWRMAVTMSLKSLMYWRYSSGRPA